MKNLTIISLLLLSLCSTAIAQKQSAVVVSDKTGWHKIGETTVDFKKERDQIMIIGSNKFANISLKVLDEPIDLRDMDIFFENGDSQKVKINSPIQAGSETSGIAIRGGERQIKKIEFEYKTLANRKGQKAHVEIYGYKSNEDH